MQRTEYSRAEYILDAIVHVVGVACGIAANSVLATITFLRAELTLAAGLGIYAFGLLCMFVCSALYNMSR